MRLIRRSISSNRSPCASMECRDRTASITSNALPATGIDFRPHIRISSATILGLGGIALVPCVGTSS